MSCAMRKPVHSICEQQRRRSGCASAQSDQHLCCSLPRSYYTSSCNSQNFKTLASLCSWAGRFVSYLVTNPEDRFSHDEAHIYSDTSTFPLQMKVKTIWIDHMLHVQDIVGLGPCYDSAVISDENFLLKTKSSLFSLLFIVHINLAYQNVVPLPNVKYDWFYISRIQFYI